MAIVVIRQNGYAVIIMIMDSYVTSELCPLFLSHLMQWIVSSPLNCGFTDLIQNRRKIDMVVDVLYVGNFIFKKSQRKQQRKDRIE